MDERLRNAPCGFFSIQEDGCVAEVNETFLHWMEYEEEELLGKHIESLLPRSAALVLHSYFFPAINLYGCIEELFINLRNADGQSIPFLLNARQTETKGKRVIDCIVVQMKKRMDYELELRTTKRKMEEAYREKEQALAKLKQIYYEIENKQAELIAINSGLRELSHTDKLTGLKNRRFFQEKLEEQIQLYSQKGTAFSLLIVDIDFFKQVNDTYGHQAGDNILVHLANVLENCARPDDIVTRFGGEEFTILLPQTTAGEAKALAAQVNRAVEQTVWGEIGGLTVSIGTSTFTDTDTDVSILFNADQALYAAKRSGRNRTVHFDELN